MIAEWEDYAYSTGLKMVFFGMTTMTEGDWGCASGLGKQTGDVGHATLED